MSNDAIGVFDSGLGGLTAVKEIMKKLPNEKIIYFGDTGRVPYGSKSDDTIIKYVKSDINFLLTFPLKYIVVACGTASTVALPKIKNLYNIPITGVVDAAVYRAIHETKNKKIGVIGTSGTIKSGAYERLLKEKDSEIETVSMACPLFVPLVENGHCDTEVTRLVIEEYLTGIKEKGVDTLILGCTHYPHLKDAIGRFMGDNVFLVDPGLEVADYLSKKLCEKGMLAEEKGKNDQYKFYVSDTPDGFARLGGQFLDKDIEGMITQIDIEKY